MKTKTKSKKRRGKTVLIVIASIIGLLIVLAGVFVLISAIGIKSNQNFIKTISAVQYDNQLEPVIDDDGCYTFVTDENLKVLQFTDVHLGASFKSIKKDTMALNAVAAMVTEEKPDLVIVTGDIAFPVPMAGTFNNKNSAKLFAELMEQLGVYWAPVFGNHDTEVYSYYTREEICDFYTSSTSSDYKHCLLQAGPEDVDGVGNYIINVKNNAGKIVQSFIMFDSHSYKSDNMLGIVMEYDRIHDNQVQWYENCIKALTEENGGEVPKSMASLYSAC